MISMKSGRIVRAGLVAAALAMFSLPSSPAVAADKWDLYVYNAVSTVSAVKGLNIVIEQIEKETGGDLAIRLHLGGSLPINTTTIMMMKNKMRLIIAQKAPRPAGAGCPPLVSSPKFIVTSQPQ